MSGGRSHVCLLTAAIAAIGRADWQALGACLDGARASGIERSLFEEALLQAVLFFGFPRAITAFETLQHHWPEPSAPPANSIPQHARRAEGERLFALIYGKNDALVRARLTAFHGELHDFVIESAYGRILARPGLELVVRELCAVTALAVLDQIPQLVAHARGALSCGASLAQVEDALRKARPDGDVSDLLERVSRVARDGPSSGG